MNCDIRNSREINRVLEKHISYTFEYRQTDCLENYIIKYEYCQSLMTIIIFYSLFYKLSYLNCILADCLYMEIVENLKTLMNILWW